MAPELTLVRRQRLLAVWRRKGLVEIGQVLWR
jgi:hypothetical protein